MHILTAFLSQEMVAAAVKEHGDLLPLPLDMSAEDEAWDTRAENYLALAKEANTAKEEANIRAWVQALVMVLNSLYEAPQSLAEGSKSNCFSKLNARGSQAVETEAVRLLRRKIELFIAALKKEGCPNSDWRKLLKGKKLGYGGEVVGKAQRLTLEQVAPGLPPEGLGASVKALDLATGRAREILENPELIMKPVEEWPEITAQASIMADDTEAINLAVDMWRRKIFRVAGKKVRVYGRDGRFGGGWTFRRWKRQGDHAERNFRGDLATHHQLSPKQRASERLRWRHEDFALLRQLGVDPSGERAVLLLERRGLEVSLLPL